MSDIDALLTELAARRPVMIDLGLDRMYAGLSALENPHRRVPPVIHIAGTNGKGSTLTFIRSILEASGNKVHAFTSPHLVRFNERIVLAGSEISDEKLMDVITRCDEAVNERTLTYFEIITAAAFLAFSESPADYLCLEVGLGGRLDATNVVDHPHCTVITPVALDHQHYLGDTLQEIASEKAGIARRDTPLVVSPQVPEVMAVIDDYATSVGANIFKYGEDWNVFEEQGRLVYQDLAGLSDLSLPKLAGAHQVMNAGLAIAALRASDSCPDDKTLSRGVENAFWPARMQQLRHGPMIDHLKSVTDELADIWLDGGHNPHAARAVAGILADLNDRLSRPVFMICGMQNNKDIERYLEPFEGLVQKVYGVQASLESVASAKDIVRFAKKTGHEAEESGDVMAAIHQIIRDYKNDKDPKKRTPRILIAGSLYLAGEVLKDHS